MWSLTFSFTHEVFAMTHFLVDCCVFCPGLPPALLSASDTNILLFHLIHLKQIPPSTLLAAHLSRVRCSPCSSASGSKQQRTRRKSRQGPGRGGSWQRRRSEQKGGARGARRGWGLSRPLLGALLRRVCCPPRDPRPVSLIVALFGRDAVVI